MRGNLVSIMDFLVKTIKLLILGKFKKAFKFLDKMAVSLIFIMFSIYSRTILNGQDEFSMVVYLSHLHYKVVGSSHSPPLKTPNLCNFEHQTNSYDL